MMSLTLVVLGIVGVFSTLLGILHFFFPVLLDFDQAIPREGTPLRPLRLGPLNYATRRTDVHGIAWIMNHTNSYTLTTIGILDLFAYLWLGSEAGRWLVFWIAGWWSVRAASQFYMGSRRLDWWLFVGLGLLAIVHLVVGIGYNAFGGMG